jgi:hypothetical protein
MLESNRDGDQDLTMFMREVEDVVSEIMEDTRYKGHLHYRLETELDYFLPTFLLSCVCAVLLVINCLLSCWFLSFRARARRGVLLVMNCLLNSNHDASTLCTVASDLVP